jgi:hypothetical protein
MKLALITDPKGFPLIKQFGLSYHLVLAQYVLEGYKYRDFYKDCHDKGDFIMMDNGAAEDGTLNLDKILQAAFSIHADEIILPDVLGDANKTLEKSLDKEVLASIPPRMRAVVPQGNSQGEWMTCANYFVGNIEFATLCIPKHTERFPGGRMRLLETIHRLGWHLRYHIHLLGVWESPVIEIATAHVEFPRIRGIDTAAPFAWAQQNITIQAGDTEGHISHVWGKSFNKDAAVANIEYLHYLATRSE